MKQNISCISIYANVNACKQAIKLLQATDAELKDISIIARQKCCDNVDALFNDSTVFEIDGFGALMFSGKKLNSVVSQYNKLSPNSDLDLQGNVLENTLFNIGATSEYISAYVQAIKENKILLLVYGTQQNVEQACEVLHNDTQQVTVHRA